MIRRSVSSTNIQSIGYDSTSRTLEIKFHSGGLYQYHGVPQTVYDSLMTSNSQGSYFSRVIKNSYHFSKLN